MFRNRLRASVGQIGQALREPEAFALAWHNQTVQYDWAVFAALGCTAILGTTTYGLIMGMSGGVSEMARDAQKLTLAAGIAWSLPLPALYILNSLSGSRLKPSTTLLAALVTTSWGGLAMMAGIPIAWFFTLAIPHPAVNLAVHAAVFTVVGIAMMDVFSRTMAKLEPRRGRLPAWWLLLVGVLGGELFYALGLFNMSFLFRA